MPELNFVEELRNDRHLFYHLDLHAETIVLEQLAERLAVDQIDGRRPIPCCLAARVRREGPCRDDEPLVGSSLHRATEIADCAGADGPLVPLALKQDMEGDEVHSNHTLAVNSTVSRFSSYLNLRESSCAQEPLRYPLERIGIDGHQLG